MADSPFRDRPYQAFLSHAHADKVVVDRLHRWFTETAGVSTWYDATHLPAGARIATELGNALAKCKTAIIVLSKASVASGWVEDEWNIASNERNRPENRGEFRIVPIRIEECDVPRFLGATKYIDIAAGADDLDAYAGLLSGFYGEEQGSAIGPVDAYVSRTWRVGREQALADQVCERLAAAQLRLIGDSPDWPNFDGKRIRLIMRSCSGLVSIVPDRPREKLKYFLEEIATARSLGLPLMVVAEQTADLPDEVARIALRAPAEGVVGNSAAEEKIGEAIQDLLDACKANPRGQHVFFATDLDDAAIARNRAAQRLLRQVTRLPCFVGEKVTVDGLQKSIIQRIQDAVAMIADISGDNLNICIEAGVARGTGVPLHLVVRGPRRSPPFMLRDIEPAFYQDDAELLGVLHRIARLYRRKVLGFGPKS